jgi:hypothetical protein
MRTIGYYWCLKENWRIYFFDGFEFWFENDNFNESLFQKIDNHELTEK